MANVKLNPVFNSFSKSIDDLVFVTRDGKTFVKKRVAPDDPKSAAQMEVRRAFTDLANIWKMMGSYCELMHASWDAYAEGKSQSGYNAFIGANARSERRHEPLELFRAMGDIYFSGFIAEPGNEGEIICTFDANELREGRVITFFIRETAEQGPVNEIDIHPFEMSAPYTAVLSGLTTGAEYQVYAVITDAEFAEAAEVSQTRAAVCVAG